MVVAQSPAESGPQGLEETRSGEVGGPVIPGVITPVVASDYAPVAELIANQKGAPRLMGAVWVRQFTLVGTWGFCVTTMMVAHCRDYCNLNFDNKKPTTRAGRVVHSVTGHLCQKGRAWRNGVETHPYVKEKCAPGCALRGLLGCASFCSSPCRNLHYFPCLFDMGSRPLSLFDHLNVHFTEGN